ncbi:MAG: hypothetical protein B6U69_03605 [Thermofilum sp. ex4484_15]|nr:MAG: hypothetical protein B6U69_03605 [Thermofilum sp. ex4484_15]
MVFKLSIVVAGPEAVFEALAFRANFEYSIRKVSELGFEGVELSVINPFKFEVKKVKKLLEDYGLKVPALSTGLGYLHYGWDLSSPDRSVRDKAITIVKGHVEVAKELGSKVIIGLLRGGVRKDVRKPYRLKLFTDSLSKCLDYAEGEGVELLLEPLNRYETNLVNKVSEALILLKELSSPNLKLLLDTFHMNIEEADLIASIKDASGKVGHVHVADSNRLAPGLGHIDFRAFLKALSEIGYNGFLSAEIMPLPDPLTAAKQTLSYLRSLS